MSSTIANLNVRLGMEIKDFEKNRRAAKRKLKQTAREFQDLGNAMTLGVSVPILGFLGRSAQLWDKQADAIAQVEAGLRSTGNAAGFSSSELQKMASGIQEITTIGDEDILRDVTAQMLTFTQVTGEQFDKAQLAAANLATKLKTDLKSASLQVGKALNDPIKGITALTRSGIQFTDQQKDMIKTLVETNRVADAQNIILAELETQFGGAAQAAAEAGLGPMKQFQNTMGDIMEIVGKQVVPILNEAAKRVKNLLQSFTELDEGTQKNVVRFGLLAAAIGPAVLAIGKLITLGGKVQMIFGQMSAAVGLYNTRMKLLTAQNAAGEISMGKLSRSVNSFRAAWGKLDLATKATTIGLVVAAIGAAYLAFQKFNGEVETMTKVTQEAEKSIISERLEAERLTNVIKSENATREEKAKALNKLKGINAAYFGQLNTEKSSIEDINTALGNYVAHLLKAAKVKAAEQKLIELEKQRLDLINNAGKSTVMDGLAGALGLNLAVVKAKELQKELKDIEDQQKKLTKVIGNQGGGFLSGLAGRMGSKISGNFKPTTAGTTPETPTTPENAERTVTALEKLPVLFQQVQSVSVPVMEQLSVKTAEIATQFESMGVIIESALMNATTAMQQAAQAGETSFKALGKSALRAAADIVRAKLMEYVSAVIAKSALSGGLFGAIAAPLAGALAGTAFNNVISGLKIPAFATGGIVTAPTLAMVGDNPSGKEAIIPLEKMDQIFGKMGGSQNVEVKILATPQGLAAMIEKGKKDRGRRSGF